MQMTKCSSLIKKIKDYWVYLLGLFVFSIFFVVDYSTSTSFLYDYPDTSDSFIFQVLGKFWLHDSIPYRDLYDNKGPFLYAMNAIGYWFVDNQTGLLFVQIPFFFITGIITFHFLQIGFNKKYSFWLSIALLLGLSYGYNGGNNACEYSLPFILCSFLLFYRWIDQRATNDTQHPLSCNYLYGVAIGFCMMTRPSNALVVLMIVAYVTFHCLSRKRIKELVLCIIITAAGCLTICLPFILYFTAKGCLYDFYYALIVSNMHYLKNTGLWESPMYMKRAIALIFSYINCFIFFIIGLYQILSNRRRRNGVLWLTMSVVCILFFVRTNCYPNYAHICFPFAIIGLLELKLVYEESNSIEKSRSLILLIAFILICTNITNGAYTFAKNTIHDKSSKKTLYAAYDEMFKSIPKEEYDSFASYNCLPEMLLRWNICPRYRFFALQGFSSSYNLDVYEKTNDEFVKGEANCILVNHWKGVPTTIQNTLNNRYQPQKKLSVGDAILVLYKKKRQNGR